MADAKLLSDNLNKHKSIVQDDSIFLVAKEGKLLLRSANRAGTIYSSYISGFKTDLNICVSLSSLQAIIKSAKTVELSVKDNRLSVIAGRSKADLPAIVSEYPTLPKKPDRTSLDTKTLNFLKRIMPLISIAYDTDIRMSIGKVDNKLAVQNYNTYYGAFAFADLPLPKDFQIGLFSQDTAAFKTMLAEEQLGMAMLTDKLYMSAIDSTLIVPGTVAETVSLRLITEGSIEAAEFSLLDMKAALSPLIAIAKSSDALNLKVTLDKNKIRLSSSNESGAIENYLGAAVKKAAEFSINYKFLKNAVDVAKSKDNLCKLFIYKVDNEIARIRLQASNVHYAMVTSV